MSIATQIGRIAKAKKDIKEVVNQDFEIINNETIDEYAEKMGSAYDEYESYIPWEHGEGDEFTFKKGGTGSYLKELEINGNTHQTTIAAETGKEVTDTTINVNDVNTEKENYITLKGNTHQDSYTGINWLQNNATTITKNGITFTINEDKTITISGTSTATAEIFILGSWGVRNNDYLEHTTYTFYSVDTIPNDIVVNLGFFNNGSNVLNKGLTSNTRTGSINLSNVTYDGISCGIAISSGKTVNGTLKLMLVKGNTELSYEPYVGGSPSPSPDYPQQIEVVTGDNTINVHGKNLWDENTQVFTNQSRFNNPTKDSNNVWNFTITGSNGYAFATSKITLQAGTYTASAIVDNGDFIILKGSATQPNTFTLTEETEITFRVYRNGNVGDVVKLSNVMIEQNPTATPYQPYQSKDYEISLGDIELCKIGDYQDYIYKDNGKWYKHSEIGKVVLDGSENWGYNTNQTYFFYTNSIFPWSASGSAIYPMYSTYFISNKFDLIYNGVIDYGIAFAYNVGRVAIRNKDKTSLADFKTWLGTHNTTVYYVLATPTNTEITDTDLIEQLEALYTAQIYNPTFIETTTSNLLPYIDLKYNVVTPSPSPERPSDIEVVSGDNIVNVHGKNLLDLVDLNRTNNGITAIVNDEIVTLNGTANANAFLRLDKKGDNYFFNLKPGTYTLSANNTATLTSNDYLRFVTQNGVGISGLSIPLNTTNASSTFTINENLENIQLQVRISSGTTLENFIIKPQLEEGLTATTYEPYHNQDYEIDLHGKNLCSSTELQSAANIRFYIDKKIEKTLTISFTTNESLNNNSLYLSATDTLATTITADANTKATATFTLSDAQYNAIQSATNPYFLLYKSGANFIIPTDAQIENNSTATDYEPYYNYELCKIDTYKDNIKKSTGKNLFKNLPNELSKDGLILTNDGATIKIKGTVSSSSHYPSFIIYADGSIISSAWWGARSDINTSKGYFTENNKTYNLSINVVGNSAYTISIGESTTVENLSTRVTGNQSKTLSNEINFIGIGFDPNQTVDLEIKLQLEENTQATDYEPYGEQWYIKKNIGKVVLNGSEDWKTGNPSNRYNLVINGQTIASIKPLSNYFIGVIANPTISDNAVFLQNVDSSTLRINLYNTSYLSNLSGFKNWLSTYNTEVYYVLATPTYEIITNETLINQLEELTKLDTYNNYSAVTATGDLINPELECVLFSQPAYQK